MRLIDADRLINTLANKYDEVDDLVGIIEEEPTVVLSAYVTTENDGCDGCAFESIEEWEMPCVKCKQGCRNYYRHMPKQAELWEEGEIDV